VFAGGAVLLVTFALAERRAVEPVLPLWVFSRRLLATTTFLALGIGVMLIGLTSYVPLYAQGEKAIHVIAYLRGDDILTVVPRLSLLLGGDWQNTSLALPGGEWTNVLTGSRIRGGSVPLKTLLHEFPVALFAKDNA